MEREDCRSLYELERNFPTDMLLSDNLPHGVVTFFSEASALWATLNKTPKLNVSISTASVSNREVLLLRDRNRLR